MKPSIKRGLKYSGFLAIENENLSHNTFLYFRIFFLLSQLIVSIKPCIFLRRINSVTSIVARRLKIQGEGPGGFEEGDIILFWVLLHSYYQVFFPGRVLFWSPLDPLFPTVCIVGHVHWGTVDETPEVGGVVVLDVIFV